MEIHETRYAKAPDGTNLAYKVPEHVGEHELKGLPDQWRLYRVVGR